MSLIKQDEKADMNHIFDVCKIGQDEKCCRYLVAGSGGFECAKDEIGLKNTIDLRVETMNAKSDNCVGYSQLKK